MLRKAIAGSILLVLLTAWWAQQHTNTLVTTHHIVRLGEGTKTLRIAHVTDLHTTGMDSLERRLFSELRRARPDVVVITGDLASPGGDVTTYGNVLAGFRSLATKTYFVPGNWEYWAPIADLKSILTKNGIVELTNKAVKLDQALWLVGFDDAQEGQPDLAVLDALPDKALKIGLFHSPSFFDQVAGQTHLNLAGHSHGGQIRLPFFRPPWLPQGTGPYDQGWFDKKGSKLFVSRGIGTSVLPLRLNCSPELAIIDVSY